MEQQAQKMPMQYWVAERMKAVAVVPCSKPALRLAAEFGKPFELVLEEAQSWFVAVLALQEQEPDFVYCCCPEAEAARFGAEGSADPSCKHSQQQQKSPKRAK